MSSLQVILGISEANIEDSMACAIREAYAATLTVVILVDNEQDSNMDE